MDTYISRLDALGKSLEGEIKHDKITTTIYSTDASVYKEEPSAVAWPKTVSDIRKILHFAAKEKSECNSKGRRYFACRTGSKFGNNCRYLKIYE